MIKFIYQFIQLVLEMSHFFLHYEVQFCSFDSFIVQCIVYTIGSGCMVITKDVNVNGQILLLM